MEKQNTTTYSQKQIAAFLEISPQLLSDYKYGRREWSKKTAIRISRISGIEIRELFFMDRAEFLAAIVQVMEKANI